jgi:hypothetical protein
MPCTPRAQLAAAARIRQAGGGVQASSAGEQGRQHLNPLVADHSIVIWSDYI